MSEASRFRLPAKHPTTRAPGLRDTHLRRRFFRYGLDLFESHAHAACAELMSRYLGYRLRVGVTYRVAVGEGEQVGECVDFIVRGTVVEYTTLHVARSMSVYWKVLSRLHKGERSRFRALWNNNCAQHHRDQRKAELQKNSALHGVEVIVVHSPRELYEEVICRFLLEDCPTAPWKIPLYDTFLEEFRSVQREVREINKLSLFPKRPKQPIPKNL